MPTRASNDGNTSSGNPTPPGGAMTPYRSASHDVANRPPPAAVVQMIGSTVRSDAPVTASAADARDHQAEPQRLGAEQPPRGGAIAGREVAAAVQQDARNDGGSDGEHAALGHGHGHGRRHVGDDDGQNERGGGDHAAW